MNSLADVFGTPAVAGLGAILPKHSERPAPAEPERQAPVQEQPDPAPTPQEDQAKTDAGSAPAGTAPAAASEPGKPARRPRPQRPQPEPVNEDDPPADVPAQISVYLLPAAITVIRKRRNGRTNAQIAFAAITAERARLPKLVADHRAPTVAAPAGLFAPQPSDRHPGAARERRVLWTFKATKHNRTVLDQLAHEAGAESRSELVAAALEAHMLPDRRR